MRIINWFSQKASRLHFLIVRPFALAAHRFRKFQYKNKNAPIRWYTNARLIADDMFLINDEDGRQAIDKDFIETLISGRSAAQKLCNKYSAISLSIVLFLLMRAFNFESSVKVFGFTLSPSKGVNEFLLIGLTTVTALVVPPFLNTIVLGNAIKGVINVLYLDPVKPFHLQSEFPEEVPQFYNPHYKPHLTWSFGIFLANNLATVFLSIIVIGLFSLLFLTRLWIYTYIYYHPGLPAPWTTIVVIGAASIEVLGIIYILMYLVPLPYRDYILLERLEMYEQTKPAYAVELRAKAYEPELSDEQEMIRKGYLKPPRDNKK